MTITEIANPNVDAPSTPAAITVRVERGMLAEGERLLRATGKTTFEVAFASPDDPVIEFTLAPAAVAPTSPASEPAAITVQVDRGMLDRWERLLLAGDSFTLSHAFALPGEPVAPDIEFVLVDDVADIRV